MPRGVPIRIGDRFTNGGHVWEVTRTLPGGVIEMIDRARSRLGRCYYREVTHWERVAPDS